MFTFCYLCKYCCVFLLEKNNAPPIECGKHSIGIFFALQSLRMQVKSRIIFKKIGILRLINIMYGQR